MNTSEKWSQPEGTFFLDFCPLCRSARNGYVGEIEMQYTSRTGWALLMIPAGLLLTGMGYLEKPQSYTGSNQSYADSNQSYADSKQGSHRREISSYGSPAHGSLERGSVEKISPQQAHKYGVQEFSIIATKNGYFPKNIIVRRNIPVNLYLTTTESRDLCFIMKGEDFSIHKGVGSKAIVKISFEPRRSGPYRFHCPINNLAGTMIVRD